ncbi:putative isoprenylcysteine alpha-carbonyl methylesterase ICMEL1 [Capsicum chinense]|nr:putative isoprenylcysteine alpha-carbonyl methylesterase ICMEL1 [Capsicum chinense]
MPFFLTLRSVQTLSDPKVVDEIKMKLFGATTFTRKTILEGGANGAPLTVFETTSHYDYDHNGCIDFSPDFAASSECSSCKCQDCKAKHDGVINAINALTASVKEGRRYIHLFEIIILVDVTATAEEHNITVDNPSTASKDEEKVEPVSLEERKNYPFEGFNISDEAPKKLTQLINDYSEWISDGLLKHHAGRVGYRWIIRFLALGCYAVLLISGFIQVGYYYFYSSQVHRGVVYGDQPRNRHDLYLPKNMNGPKSVVAFVTGGAWIIGYKAWGSLLGQQLSERDIIVACIDYRNFPQGTIGDMVKDASQGISFICNKIAEYGGDPNRIYLMGQSAGAHIAACTLLEQAIKEADAEQRASWSVSQIKAYFGLSGGYNFLKLIDHFHSRGLYRSILLSIMEGEQGLRRYSPEVMAQDPNAKSAVSLLPPIVLFHGTADYSIPCDSRYLPSTRSFYLCSKLLTLAVSCRIIDPDPY